MCCAYIDTVTVTEYIIQLLYCPLNCLSATYSGRNQLKERVLSCSIQEVKTISSGGWEMHRHLTVGLTQKIKGGSVCCMQDVHVSRAECHILQVCIAHAVHSHMLLVDVLMQCMLHFI